MTEQPPPAATDDLGRLKAALAAAIPARTESNLLVGTWNIRALGDLTAKWVAGPKDSPKRDWHAIACLAAVISRFDLVAVQESRRNPAALKQILVSLGPGRRFIISDATEGPAGNGERIAFLYDTTRVQPSGLVGEIVLPQIGENPQRQFARTQYTASFSRAGVELTLASVHILWGKNPAERLPEITAFAKWMHDWAVRPNDWNSNLIVLGDFNLDRDRRPALRSVHLHGPLAADRAERRTADDLRRRQNQALLRPAGLVLHTRRHLPAEGPGLRAAGRNVRFHPARLPRA